MEQALLYISHLFSSRHRKGFGIHAPFAFEFVSGVIFGKDAASYDVIESIRREQVRSRQILEITDMGAGGKAAFRRKSSIPGNTTSGKQLGRIVSGTSVSSKKGRLLGRIAAYLDYPDILELGTGPGFSSMYLGTASPSSNIHTCEGSERLAELAGKNISNAGLGNVDVSCAAFMDWLPMQLDEHPGKILIYLDGDHRGERLLDYTGLIMDSVGKNTVGDRESDSRTVLVLDDIHWSRDMYLAWKQIVSEETVPLSFELFNLGIVFISFPVQPGRYKIRF